MSNWTQRLLRHARERLDAEMAGRWNVSDGAARRRGLARAGAAGAFRQD